MVGVLFQFQLLFQSLQSWDSTAPDYLLFPTAEDTTPCECLVLVWYCCQPNWLPSNHFGISEPGTGAGVEDLLERVSLLTSSDSSLASFAVVTLASFTWGSCIVQRFVAKRLPALV